MSGMGGVTAADVLGVHHITVHVPVHVTVDTLLCVIFALLTSASNAAAAVLQRKAAAQVPADKAMHLSLIRNLFGRPIWLAGIALVVVAAVFQAAALATGPIALVQPIFIIELPVTLLLSRSCQPALPATAALGRHRAQRRSVSAPGWPSPRPAGRRKTPRTPPGSSRSS